MNSTQIFTLALGLTEPWEITYIDITNDDKSIKELHLNIAFKKGSKFKDDTETLCPVHDTKLRKWRHMCIVSQGCSKKWFFVILCTFYQTFLEWRPKPTR